jgi:hypothetical protein
MPFGPGALRTAILCFSTLVPACVQAEGIDTEHLFGFTIGTDVGSKGEREFQSQTTGRFSKAGGGYRAINQELELELVPAENFRAEFGSSFTSYDISGVSGLQDRRQLDWQGVSLDLRYRLLDREKAPFGLTFALDSRANRFDEITAASARKYGTELTMALDRELIPNRLVTAFNLSYEPEWTHFLGTGATEQESTVGAAMAVMAQIRNGFLIGGEVRYFRKYDGIGLERLAGQALLVGPTAYVQLSDRSRITIAWSAQAWGRAAGSTAVLDLVNFERHQARLIFGVNF